MGDPSSPSPTSTTTTPAAPPTPYAGYDPTTGLAGTANFDPSSGAYSGFSPLTMSYQGQQFNLMHGDNGYQAYNPYTGGTMALGAESLPYLQQIPEFTKWYQQILGENPMVAQNQNLPMLGGPNAYHPAGWSMPATQTPDPASHQTWIQQLAQAFPWMQQAPNWWNTPVSDQYSLIQNGPPPPPEIGQFIGGAGPQSGLTSEPTHFNPSIGTPGGNMASFMNLLSHLFNY